MKQQNENTVKETDTLVSKSVEELRDQVRKFLKNDHDRVVVTVTVSEEKVGDEIVNYLPVSIQGLFRF